MVLITLADCGCLKSCACFLTLCSVVVFGVWLASKESSKENVIIFLYQGQKVLSLSGNKNSKSSGKLPAVIGSG